MNKFVVFGGGTNYGHIPEINKGDFVAAADKGYYNCIKAGIKPDIAVGDWDSASAPDDCERIDLAVEKDDTDTLAALREGIKRGFSEFHIYCGTGGDRFDHTLANLQSLAFLSKQGKTGYLYDDACVITAVTDGRLFFPPAEGGDISVFAADGTARGVTIKGLKYSLSEGELKCDFPIGVSNSFVGKSAEISVKEGTLLVVFPISNFPAKGEENGI